MLWTFLGEEWRRAMLGYCAGAFLAFAAAMAWTYSDLVQDHLNDQYLGSFWSAPGLWFILAPLFLVGVVKAAGVSIRAARAWVHGVTSGAFFWPFSIGLASFWITSDPATRGILGFAATLLALALGFVLRLAGGIERERTVEARIREVRVARPLAQARDTDSPIESWEEDRLSWSPFVSMLASRVLTSRAPVIAVRGDFGCGKSSVLNLLRQELSTDAIVVSFSTWLPDSEKTLVDDLLNDIAAEINRHFLVPGLRSRLHEFASLIGGTVPHLKALPDMFPPYTQRRGILELGNLLGRLPKRTVVLLDEIDRMQREELLALLKVVRGAYSLPNITFVCALQQEQVERVACSSYDSKSHEFFEKFFPTAIDVPKPSSDILKGMLCDRLLGVLKADNWITDFEGQDGFGKRLSDLWDSALTHVCTNIRKIRLVANDVSAAAPLVKHEVDPIDLCALEVMRRFYPKVYELIWTNASYFSGSDKWWKRGRYRPDGEVQAQIAKIAGVIKESSDSRGNESAINALLAEMFPLRAKDLRVGRPRQEDGSEALHKAETGRRISHPDYFPVCFRWQVPESVFSSVEMREFEDEVQLATSDAECRAVFQRRFDALEKGSFRRYDFVHKLALRLETLPIDQAESVARAMVLNAENFAGDHIVGEGQRALAGVLAVAQRLSKSQDINRFIGECIGLAGTDLFAARLYTIMTSHRARNKIVQDFDHVCEPLIQGAFAARMDSRYGPSVDVANLDLSMLESYPFGLWAEISPDERSKEISCWERYIGGSRRRLAEVFNLIAPAGVYWAGDGDAYVERMIPTVTLRRMYTELAPDAVLEPPCEAALVRLDRFLKGELRAGVILGSERSGEEPADPLIGPGQD
jgi:hypothetical protein